MVVGGAKNGGRRAGGAVKLFGFKRLFLRKPEKPWRKKKIKKIA
jgi:hypothetical protein